MSTFAEQLDELIKDSVNDIIDEKISDHYCEYKDEIDNIRYEVEQVCDSSISDMKDDILSEVDTMITDAIQANLEESKKNINSDDMRYINDLIKALIDERLSKTVSTIYQTIMKELNGYVQSTPPYKGN